MSIKTVYLIILVLGFVGLSAQPHSVNLHRQHLSHIDAVIQSAIEKKDIPGAVVLIGDKEHVYYRKSFGNRQLVPIQRKMRMDMMFDMASVTKPMATATSVMILAERGMLRLTDRVSDYIPSFSRYMTRDSVLAKEARLYHLLNHTSGLPAYTNAKKAAKVLESPCSVKELAHYIAGLPKLSSPNETYRYSCLGYIVLGYIIEEVSGLNLHAFSQKHIYQPLNMNHTMFIPPDSLALRCVPTEKVDEKPLIGVVHDPLARLQGGISGNAGLFSTADDLMLYARMLINGGTWNNQRILGPLTIERMTRSLPDSPNANYGYGWVIKDGISWVGGDLLPDGGFGHTGYTGTSLWIDRSTQLFIILLSNRVHPKDDGAVDWLRSSIANIVAAAVKIEYK